MQTIYEPKGRAQEYADFAANPYKGCAHACRYCYGPNMMRTTSAKFHGNPQPRRGFVGELDKAVAKFAAGPNADKPIFLAFSCDAFQPIEAEHKLGLRSCEILVKHGLRVAVLTKGGMKTAKPALDALAADPRGPERHWWGTTLTVGSGGHAAYWEPGAALPTERVELLKAARAKGLRSWVSFEPVIKPDSTMQMIRTLSALGLMDHCAIGKLNYMDPPESVDWPGFRLQVIGLLRDLGYTESETNLPEGLERSFYIKQSLREAA